MGLLTASIVLTLLALGVAAWNEVRWRQTVEQMIEWTERADREPASPTYLPSKLPRNRSPLHAAFDDPDYIVPKEGDDQE